MEDREFLAAEIERWGLKAELIHGAGLEILRAHFEAGGIRVREDAFEAFRPYLDGEHSLVAVRLSSKADFLKEFPEQAEKRRFLGDRWPCVYVEFPSGDVFYPVHPTGFFGDVVPIRLYVLGYVDASRDDRRPFDWDGKEVRFFRQERSSPGEPARFFDGAEPGFFSYTTISFESKGGRYAADLVFRTHLPFRFRYAETLHTLHLGFESRPNAWFAAGIASGLLLQLLCMFLAGKILTGRWTVVSGWAIAGFVYFGGILGVFSALCVVSGVKHPALARIAERGWLRPKYVLLSSALFLFLVFALHEIAMLPLRPL
ncbi:MAG: hypothetical protein MUC63_02450 [Planctomycetes bacterium]|nr:hypothetical protein [Planctomycetota bacterium]